MADVIAGLSREFEPDIALDVIDGSALKACSSFCRPAGAVRQHSAPAVSPDAVWWLHLDAAHEATASL